MNEDMIRFEIFGRRVPSLVRPAACPRGRRMLDLVDELAHRLMSEAVSGYTVSLFFKKK